MEEITTAQMNYILDLAVKYKVNQPEFKHMSIKEADLWIKEIIYNGKEKSDEVKLEVNPVLMGMVYKLVYRKFCDDGMNPLDHKKKFLKEVQNVYLLFEFK